MAEVHDSRLAINRRSLLKGAGLCVLGSTAVGEAAARSSLDLVPPESGTNIYESIGVRPIVNCKGTYTILSGSLSLPEVKKAMEEASQHYVQMDELMEAVGKRLAELTHAEWGIVTAGCAAAITHATTACIVGTNPERMQRVPKLDGLKSEVIMPHYSRNVYDHAARMLGVSVIEVNSESELEAAFNPGTAMVLILSSPSAEKGPLSVENVCRVARSKGVPVLVDAAAETPTFPNHHLQHGANMVAYSGGKCMRGPQCAGVLLGQKDLLKAAWANSAPHHAFGRSLKVGKEEIMGMLTAVEMWTKRDHQAEWKTWEAWLAYINERVTRIPGVSTGSIPPVDLSNHAPQLQIKWDAAVLNITGTEVSDTLAAGNPRIFLADATGKRPDQLASSVTIMPYMMMPEDHKVVAEALSRLLAHPPKFQERRMVAAQPEDIAGVWSVNIEHSLGEARHQFLLEQKGEVLRGVHEGEWVRGDLKGRIHGKEVQIASVHPIEGTAIEYNFIGVVEKDSIRGALSMGEYGKAKWSANRHR